MALGRTLSLGFGLALVLAFPSPGAQVRAQEVSAYPAAAATAADDSTADDGRAKRRLLHARGGGVLRGESRRVGDRWESRRDGEWTALPPGLVVRARLEADALREMRERERRVPAGDLAARAEHAAWMLGEGLLVEALESLDDVLREAPDEPRALALLEREAPRIVGPEPAVDGGAEERVDVVLAALDRAAAYPPALREAALSRVPAVPEAALVVPLRERLVDRSPGRRAVAALALRRLADARALGEAELAELLRRAARDVSEDVRAQASATLGSVGQEGLILPFVAALGSESGTIRIHAAQALGRMGYPAAVEPLVQAMMSAPAAGGGWSGPRANVFVGRQIAFVQDFDVDIAQNAAIADPHIGTLQEGASLDVRVLGVGGPSGAQLQTTAMRDAVERLTGSRPPAGRAAVAAWWRDRPAPASASPTGAGAAR